MHVVRGPRGQVVSGSCLSDPFIDLFMCVCVRASVYAAVTCINLSN